MILLLKFEKANEKFYVRILSHVHNIYLTAQLARFSLYDWSHWTPIDGGGLHKMLIAFIFFTPKSITKLPKKCPPKDLFANNYLLHRSLTTLNTCIFSCHQSSKTMIQREINNVFHIERKGANPKKRERTALPQRICAQSRRYISTAVFFRHVTHQNILLMSI